MLTSTVFEREGSVYAVLSHHRDLHLQLAETIGGPLSDKQAGGTQGRGDLPAFSLMADTIGWSAATSTKRRGDLDMPLRGKQGIVRRSGRHGAWGIEKQTYSRQGCPTCSPARIREEQATRKIYKLTNMVNGKAYVGQAVDIAMRWHGHKSAAASNKREGCRALQCAIRKYGWKAFRKEILAVCDEAISRQGDEAHRRAWHSLLVDTTSPQEVMLVHSSQRR